MGKRGIIYNAMKREGYNVLAFGQHSDDFAESLIMSLFFNSNIRTMKVNYEIDAGGIRVIRPLVYVHEQSTKDFAYSANLPVIAENCPGCFEAPVQRARIKKLLASQEMLFP